MKGEGQTEHNDNYVKGVGCSGFGGHVTYDWVLKIEQEKG